MNESFFNDLVQPIIEDRPWLILTDFVGPGHYFASKLQDLGARKVLVVVVSGDAGQVPVEPDYPIITMGIRSTPGLGAIRTATAVFRDLPPDVCAQIDAWDPDKEAVAFTPLWGEDVPAHGRKVFGARWPQWQKLEDKLICDGIWDAIGVARSPFRVLPLYEAALQVAHQELDQGMGTVWAGDNKEGWHGGAEYIRWIRSPGDFRAAFPFFRSHCEQVRIQPFMEGIPCSIHGMVFPDSVIAFRPCEMLVFRQHGSTRLKYGGAATAWDPPAADREAMRQTAKTTGAYLRQHYGYRGIFTIDGIMTKDGFRPTELNPRYGAALGRFMSGLSHIPLYILNKILCEGIPLDYDPALLERTIIESADENRVILAGFETPDVGPKSEVTARYKYTETGWVANEGSDDAVIHYRPEGQGGYIKVSIRPEAVTAGESPAGHIVTLLRQSHAKLGHGLTSLEPAPNVRH